jgi:hypothetical protein
MLPALFAILRDLRDLAFDVRLIEAVPKTMKNLLCFRQIIKKRRPVKRATVWKMQREPS